MMCRSERGLVNRHGAYSTAASYGFRSSGGSSSGSMLFPREFVWKQFFCRATERNINRRL
jgi:hypothetical protein